MKLGNGQGTRWQGADVRHRQLIAAIALLGMSAACGVRWTDDQQAEMSARYATGDRSGSNGGAAGPSGTSPAGQGAGASGSGSGSSSGGGAATGTGGTGSSTGAAAASPRPCAAASDAPGVSATELAIGTVNSLSGPIPGLGASYLGATNAYVEYRNSTGGVCGRNVRLVAGDDGGDLARNRSVVAEMAPRVLGIVPGIAGGGDGGADIISRDRIPAVGTAVSPGLEKVPTYYGVRPILPDYDAVTPKYRYLAEQGVHTAAVVYVAAASAPAEASRNRQLMEAAGIRVVLDLALPLTTLSYDSPARAVANSKADYLFFVHEAGTSAAMARSLAGAGYQLEFAEYIVAYGSNFIDLADERVGGCDDLDRQPPRRGRRHRPGAGRLHQVDGPGVRGGAARPVRRARLGRHQGDARHDRSAPRPHQP